MQKTSRRSSGSFYHLLDTATSLTRSVILTTGRVQQDTLSAALKYWFNPGRREIVLA